MNQKLTVMNRLYVNTILLVLMLFAYGCGSNEGNGYGGVKVQYPVYEIEWIEPELKCLIEEKILPLAVSKGIDDNSGTLLLEVYCDEVDLYVYNVTDSIPVAPRIWNYSLIRCPGNRTIYLVAEDGMDCLLKLDKKGSADLNRNYPIFYVAEDQSRNCICEESYDIESGNERVVEEVVVLGELRIKS